MPLTPADIHNVAFKKPPIGKRGYDEEEVDAFLDEVERELARLLEENVELRARLGPVANDDREQRLRAEITSLRSQWERVQRDKVAAEQAATQVQAELEQARSQSLSVGGGGGGEPQGGRVLLMAQRTADDHVNDARREGESVLAEARVKAERTVQEAQGKAEVVEREAHERHQQAVGSLDRKRSELLEEISGLTGLAKDYRNRLQEALANLLMEMETVPANGRANRPPQLLDADGSA